MSTETLLAYAEVYEILKLLENEYVERIPQNVRNFFEEERDKNYNPKINTDIPLTQQNLKRETMILLAVLNLNYWCENEAEKQNFLNELAKNEKEKRELEERYNSDNLFKNRKYNNVENSEKIEENVSLVEYKKISIFKRILEKITRFFKRG